MPETTSLSRIPFRAEDETMLVSLSGWMRFVGLFTIASGLIGFFIVLLLSSFLSLLVSVAIDRPDELRVAFEKGAQKAEARAELEGRELTPEQQKTIAVMGQSADRLPAFLARNRWGIYGLALFGMLAIALSIASGYFLWSAADDLARVARTDLADQDLIAQGLGKVGTYFKINVATIIISALVSTIAAISFGSQIALLVGRAAASGGGMP